MGSFALTGSVNSFLASKTCYKSEKCDDTDDDVFAWVLGFADFPSPAYETDG